MDELERFRLLSKVFRQLPDTFAGLKVQPLTAGRWDLLRARENSFLFSGDEPHESAPKEADYEDHRSYSEALAEWKERQESLDSESMFAICEFLWVHTAHVSDVLALDADPAEWKRAVKRFALETGDMAEIIEYMLAFRDRTQQLAAAMVDPVEDGKEGDEGEPGKTLPSPTGSPATFSPSAATGPASDGIGCSGGSPSPRASSTSTVPTVMPDRTASGPGRPEVHQPFGPPANWSPPAPGRPSGSDG